MTGRRAGVAAPDPRQGESLVERAANVMESSHGTVATATAEAKNPGNNPQIVEFTPRASSIALRWLATADVTPTGRRVGRFMAGKARFATAADVDRKVAPGDVFCYWPLATVAAALGCSERQVKRGVRSLREAGFEVRRRVRPFEASYVFPVPSLISASRVPSHVPSGVPSGVPSHTKPRTEPEREPRKEPTRANRANPRRASEGEVEFAIRLATEKAIVLPRDVDAFRAQSFAVDGWKVTRLIGLIKRGESVQRYLPPKPPKPDVDPAKVTQAALPLEAATKAADGERQREIEELATLLAKADDGSLVYGREWVPKWRARYATLNGRPWVPA